MKPPTTAHMTGTVSRCFGNGKETKCTKGFIREDGYKFNGAPCKSNTCSTKAKPPVIAPQMVKPPPLIMKPPTTARMTGTVSRCFGNGKKTMCTKGFIGWGGYKFNGAPCKSNTCSTKKPTKPTNCKFPKDQANKCYWAV